MESDDLVTVYTVFNPIEAEIIKNALEAEEIPCFVEGINQAAEPGLAALPIHIQVPAGEADRARMFIQTHEHHRDEPDSD